jgi:hypothetical protein
MANMRSNIKNGLYLLILTNQPFEKVGLTCFYHSNHSKMFHFLEGGTDAAARKLKCSALRKKTPWAVRANQRTAYSR